MSFTTETISPGKVAVTITLPAATIAAKEKEVIKTITSEVRLPGFRPGHVPAHLIRKQYAEGLREELAARVYRAAYRIVTDESDLKIYALADASGAENLSTDADATLRLEIELKPEFEVADHKSIAIPTPSLDVTDADVDKAVEDARGYFSQYEVVDRPIGAGDYVKLAFSGTLDGTPLRDAIADIPAHLASQNSSWEEAGNTDAPSLSGITTAIIGKKSGEKLDCPHTFADDFSIEALRGKTVSYGVEIFEVRTKIPAELNEDFFKKINVANLEELRTQLRGNLVSAKKREAFTLQQKAIEAGLLDLAPDFPVPESLIAREYKTLAVEHAMSLQRRGLSEEEMKAELTKEETRESIKKEAATAARRYFIAEKIAEKEGVKLEQSDIVEYVSMQAQYRNMTPEKFVKEYLGSQEAYATVQRQLLQLKVQDFIRDAILAKDQPAPAQ